MADETALNEKFLERCKWLFGKRELTAEDMAMIQYMKDDLGFHNEDAIWGVIKVFANGRRDMERNVLEMKKTIGAVQDNVAAMKQSVSDIGPALDNSLTRYREKGGVFSIVQVGDCFLTAAGMVWLVGFIFAIGIIAYFAGLSLNPDALPWLKEIHAYEYIDFLLLIRAGWIFCALMLAGAAIAGWRMFELLYGKNRDEIIKNLKKLWWAIPLTVLTFYLGVSGLARMFRY